MDKQQSLIAIVGPTATGKSQLAVFIAQALGGEVVNADSRQIYRYMDIGTAKPSQEDRAGIPHHILDIINPDEHFNVALYRDLALAAISGIQAKGRAPVLSGGTGFYIWTLLEGRPLAEVPPDPGLRQSLLEKAQKEGNLSLHQELERVDSAAAARIHPNNLRRVIRALEVCVSGGKTFSGSKGSKTEDNLNKIIIGLTADRTDLYHRIDNRVENMIKRGLVGEVESLVKKGYRLELPAMSGLGYKQIGSYLKGETDLPSAIQKIKYETHRYARQQYNWFRLSDTRIKWFLTDTGYGKIVEYINDTIY